MTYRDKVQLMYKVMQQALVAKMQNDYTSAISLMDDFITQQDLDAEMRSEALSFRASLKEDMQDYQSAKEDLLKALSLSQAGSYAKYTIELGLGNLSERSGLRDGATSWYQAALETSISGDGIAGGSALKRFLDLKGESDITDQERELCKQVIKHSWTRLHIADAPDLMQLGEMADILIKASGA